MDQEFVEKVVKWIKIDDKIKQLILQTRELKQEKKQLEETILNTMKTSDEDVINMSSGGTLRLSVSKTKSGLKQDYIQEILSQYTKDPQEAVAITEMLMTNRPIREREYLKRSNPRNRETST
jgi:seryl-tRNA synthetase